MRPSSQHAPGLPKDVNGQIDKTLHQWKKTFARPASRGKGKKDGK